MTEKKLESHLVRRLMPNASPEEIDDATRRWFAYLQLLDALITEREQQDRDSRTPPSYVRFDSEAQHNL